MRCAGAAGTGKAGFARVTVIPCVVGITLIAGVPSAPCVALAVGVPSVPCVALVARSVTDNRGIQKNIVGRGAVYDVR